MINHSSVTVLRTGESDYRFELAEGVHELIREIEVRCNDELKDMRVGGSIQCSYSVNAGKLTIG